MVFSGNHTRPMALNRSETLPPPLDCAELFRNITLLMDDNITSVKRDMYSVAVPVYVTICTVVMIANGTVLCAASVIKHSSKEHPTLPLTLSLAVADLWTSVAMAFSFVYNSYLFFVFGITANACVSLAFEAVRTGGLITGSLHLLALALIHYLTIRFPTSYQNMVTARSNWAVIFFIWLAPPVSLFIFMSSLPDQFFRSPYIPCHGYCMAVSVWHTLEFRLVIFFAFFSPFILTSILYFMFLTLFRRQEKKFTRVSSPNPREEDLKGRRRSSIFQSQKNQRQQLQKSRRTFTTTILIWFTFILGWMPACSLFVLTCRTCLLPFPRETSDNVRAVFTTSVISNLFILCKSLLNPIIYAVRIPEIKMALAKRYGWCSRFFMCCNNERPSKNGSSSRCSVRRPTEGVGHDREDDVDEPGNEFKTGQRNRKPKNDQRSRADAEKEKQMPQERDILLKNNSPVGIDCEMYENRKALDLDPSSVR